MKNNYGQFAIHNTRIGSTVVHHREALLVGEGGDIGVDIDHHHPEEDVQGLLHLRQQVGCGQLDPAPPCPVLHSPGLNWMIYPTGKNGYGQISTRLKLSISEAKLERVW